MICGKGQLYTLLHNENDNHIIDVRDKDGVLLFTCVGASDSYFFKLPHKNQNNRIKKEKSDHDTDNKIRYAAMASCIMDFQIALSDTKSEGNILDSNKKISDNDFTTWFHGIVKDRILIPDTNSLINRSLSSLCFILGDEYLKSVNIRIPRLTILEMERMANQEQNKGEKQERKRRIMSTAAELSVLKNNGARFLPELPIDLFEGFPRMAGSQATDSWIRREVYQQIKKETFGIEQSKRKIVTFITSDLINALSATAEEIDTLFFSRAGNLILDKKYTLKQIIQTIVLCSIVFEQIKVSIDSRHYLFSGIWDGKTPLEWLTDSVMISDSSQ